jgi:hypothetical protein
MRLASTQHQSTGNLLDGAVWQQLGHHTSEKMNKD